MTILSRLDHGVSYTKLSEIITETAYTTITKSLKDGKVCLLEHCRKREFSTLVEDNIDRNEETLKGILVCVCEWVCVMKWKTQQRIEANEGSDGL